MSYPVESCHGDRCCVHGDQWAEHAGAESRARFVAAWDDPSRPYLVTQSGVCVHVKGRCYPYDAVVRFFDDEAPWTWLTGWPARPLTAEEASRWLAGTSLGGRGHRRCRVCCPDLPAEPRSVPPGTDGGRRGLVVGAGQIWQGVRP